MQMVINTIHKPVFNNDVLRSSQLAGKLTILAWGWLASPSRDTVPIRLPTIPKYRTMQN